ncbi:MAG: hypothetical protein GY835_17925 [bacterium]|nr:hypothetical protein [bacterium]
MYRMSFAILLSILLLSSAALAEVPRVITVQGILTEDTGGPVSDGQHSAIFKFFRGEDSGPQIWESEEEIATVRGLFNHSLTLPVNHQGFFNDEIWLEITLYDGGVLEPRIQLTAAPFAMRAAVADSVVGGSSGGGEDDDWVINGDDIAHASGRVFVGVTGRGDAPERRTTEERDDRYPSTSKLFVQGTNEGFFARLIENDVVAVGRSAIYGSRTRQVVAPGGGFAEWHTNTAVTGHNEWGDSYTFGVAGYTWDDFPHTAGVLGAFYNGTSYAALGYLDANSRPWSLYTDSDARIGGTAEVGGFKMETGAAAGYILTSNSSGEASWQLGTGSGNDGDWMVAADDLYHDGGGIVAIGTSTPEPMTNNEAAFQVVGMVNPALLLDEVSGSFSRWAIYNQAYYGRLVFGRTTSNSGLAPALMTLSGTGRLALGGLDSEANLKVPGGNGNVYSHEGDFNVGDADNQFRLGVFTSGGLMGEVNMRANSSTGTAALHLGVDDHDVVRIGTIDVDFVDASGTRMVQIHTSEAGNDLGSRIDLYSTTYGNPILSLDAQSSTSGGGATISMKQETGLTGMNLQAQENGYGGGILRMYNASGHQSLTLDAHYSASGTSRVITDALEITGGADLSEQFDVVGGKGQPEPGMVVCIDPGRPGQLTLSGNAYDRRVAGVISGAGDVRPGMLMGQRGSVADGDLPVALVGRVYVWADASNGPITPGDLLTTSSTPGHAMRVDDHTRAMGAILGKAMTGLDQGRGLVLVLVSLQ